MTETIKIDEEEWPTLHQFGPEGSAWGPAAIWRSRIDLSDNFTKRIKLRPHQQSGQVTPADAARYQRGTILAQPSPFGPSPFPIGDQ